MCTTCPVRTSPLPQRPGDLEHALLPRGTESSGCGDPVSEHADPLDLELDDVAGLEPAAVAELEDAARADGSGAEDVSGEEASVPRRVGDDRVPRVVHVDELEA